MYTIVVKRNQPKFQVKSVDNDITIRRSIREINIRTVGKRGIQGEPGEGIPVGGTPGQLLVKSSDTDYDTEWSSISGSDKNFYQAFTAQSEVTVTHNLAKYPSISIFDSAGDEIEGAVEHVSINELIIRFTSAFTGRITCN